MVKGLGPGEWWRSPSDWHYDALRRRAGPPARSRAVARRAAALITERVDEQTVVLRQAGDPLAWAAMDAALPPGPREPAALQTLEWVARPTAFLRRCAAAYGEAFTIRLAFDDAPLVLVWHPDAVRAVYAADPSVARRGAQPGPAAPRSRARARSSSPTARSTCASAG